jgi:hypothetical protein
VVTNVLGGLAAGKIGSEADKHFQRVTPNMLRIKRGFIPNMLTDGMIYANDTILETVLEELKEAMSGRMGSFIPSLTQGNNPSNPTHYWSRCWLNVWLPLSTCDCSCYSCQCGLFTW